MSYSTLIANVGFIDDPFAHTNADEEERIETYFIAPPFFNPVYGDPKNPKSAIVFAPRGGGKTALKRKIELSSTGNEYLCVAYNTFDTTGIKLVDIDFDYHANNIIRLILVGLLTQIGNAGLGSLGKDDRHFLYLFIKAYLNELERHELNNAIKSSKNFSDTAKEWWNRFTGPIGLVINTLLQKIGLGDAEIKEFAEKGGKIGDRFQQFEKLYDFAKKVGFSSIYVLIDRVDETDITGTGDKSFQFISPILTNLHLLELKGYSFKFFLWDLLLEPYREVARPDRIKYYILEWKPEQLVQMLSARLAAYSDQKIKSLSQISEFKSSISLDMAVVIFANESPRNLVRISRALLDQQSEVDDSSRIITEGAINTGVSRIADDISSEHYNQNLISELIRVGECDFTVRRIYNDIFKFSQQAGINKVQVWVNFGAVVNVGKTQETSGAKPSNLYALSNPILAKHILRRLSVKDFIEKKIKVCESCGKILIRDWGKRDEYLCHECQSSTR